MKYSHEDKFEEIRAKIFRTHIYAWEVRDLSTAVLKQICLKSTADDRTARLPITPPSQLVITAPVKEPSCSVKSGSHKLRLFSVKRQHTQQATITKSCVEKERGCVVRRVRWRAIPNKASKARNLSILDLRRRWIFRQTSTSMKFEEGLIKRDLKTSNSET